MSTTTTAKLATRRYLVVLTEPDCSFTPLAPDDWPEVFSVSGFHYSPDDLQDLADAREQAARLNCPRSICQEYGFWAIVVRDWNNDAPRLPGYYRFSGPRNRYAMTFVRKGGEL